MKVLKKYFSLLLALLLLLSLAPAVFAEDEITIIDPVGETDEPIAETEDPDLIVLSEPNASATITVQPKDVTAVEGSTVSFHIEAESSEGEVGYVWQYRPPSGGEYKNCSSGSGMKTDTYSLQAIMYRDGYSYCCMVYVNGFPVVRSHEVKLSITEAPGRPEISGPGWGEIVDVNTELNGTAAIQISATGDDLRYQWQYRPFSNSSNYETGWSNCSGSEAKTPELHVQALKYRNNYMYRCKVYNDITYTYSGYYRLTIGELPAPPQISGSDGTTTHAVHLGETMKLDVTATGKSLKYQWYFRTSSEGAWTKCSADGSTKAKFEVKAYGYRDGYEYRCKVYNDGGSAWSRIHLLTILPQDVPAISLQPHDVTQTWGVYAYFFTQGEGTNVKYQWQYKPVGSQYWNNCTGPSATTQAKGVYAEWRREGYQYRCKIYNGAGAVYTAPVTLHVENSVPLTILKQPQELVSDKQVMLYVDVEGADSYQWYYRKSIYSDPDVGWSRVSQATRPALYVFPQYVFPETYHMEYRCKLTHGDTVAYTDIGSVTWGVPES